MSDETPVRHPGAPAPGSLIPSHNPMCFGCGSGGTPGLGMSLRAGPGVSVTGKVTILEWHQGAPGLAHGGVLAAVMDELLGSLNWMLMQPSVTARLTTDFIRPVPVDTTLWLDAEGVKVAGRKFTARGSARVGGPEGEVAVRAEALFIGVSREHFLQHGRPQDVQRALDDGAWQPEAGGP